MIPFCIKEFSLKKSQSRGGNNKTNFHVLIAWVQLNGGGGWGLEKQRKQTAKDTEEGR